jgi:glycine/D-amino acid oxidase-like deaminating enzyme
MTRQKVLISGVGIAGATLAFRLNNARFETILVERAPDLRTGGHVVGFWGLGYDIAERTGVIERINAGRLPGQGTAERRAGARLNAGRRHRWNSRCILAVVVALEARSYRPCDKDVYLMNGQPGRGRFTFTATARFSCLLKPQASLPGSLSNRKRYYARCG